ncbi:hypothetical protein [Hydrogenimonas sp.]
MKYMFFIPREKIEVFWNVYLAHKDPLALRVFCEVELHIPHKKIANVMLGAKYLTIHLKDLELTDRYAQWYQKLLSRKERSAA